jgi:hypothetical protein
LLSKIFAQAQEKTEIIQKLMALDKSDEKLSMKKNISCLFT